MSDNIIRFDRFYRIKRKLPGSGTPNFHRAYDAAAGFLLLAQSGYLSCPTLTDIAGNFPTSPMSMLRFMLIELRDAEDDRDLG
jgi:hypothetical protein